MSSMLSTTPYTALTYWLLRLAVGTNGLLRLAVGTNGLLRLAVGTNEGQSEDCLVTAL